MNQQSRSQSNTNILFRDLYGIVLVLFVGLVAILVQAKANAGDDAETKMPGNLEVFISWPTGDDDVDLWLNGPRELTPIGYSNKGGITWNLLRDDLGKTPDFLPDNFENAFSRGLPGGEYRVNVQCYRCPDLPVEVKAEVTMRQPGQSAVVVLAQAVVTLRRDHEEKTVVDFKLDGSGKLIPDSLNNVFVPLRSGTGK